LIALLNQPLDVKIDGFPYQSQDGLSGLPDGNATRQIGHVRAVRILALLDNDCIFHLVHIA
jgi:hypothetical protein